MDWSPQSPDLSIIKVVWDHLDKEQNKRWPTSKNGLGMSFKKPEKLFLKTT